MFLTYVNILVSYCGFYLTYVNYMKDFISTTEAADMLKVSRVTLFNKIKSGEIKATKVGRNYIIQKEEILNLVDNGLSKSKRDKIEHGVDRVIEEYGETLKLLKDN